jgi:hypothetical protein
VGITALATDIRDEEFTDSQGYLHRFIVCASHKVHSIDEIWFDDKQAWTVGGGVLGEFAGYLTVAVITEGSAANAINISARMGSDRRYTGCAYVHLTYKLTGNSKKADSPFAQSITTRITIRGHAALFYDARLDSTVAGGSGSHRADDQSTWAWDDDACRNPALTLLFYLLGWQINGLLAVGKGIPPSRIDLESFAVAANLCDELVTKIGDGTEPRYRCDGVWSEGDSPTSVIDMIKASMNADLDDIDGKLRLTVFHDDLATPAADFTDDDILDDFNWDPAADLSDSFNVVRGIFTDPSDTSLYQQIDYPQVEEASPDGIDRIDTFDLPMVESAGQAQRLAQLRLMRQKFGGTFRANFQATAWKVEKNSILRLSFSPRGWVNKLFRVAEMDLRIDGVVPLVLREESSLIYGAPALAAPVDPVASTPYDPSLNPWLEQINTTEQLLIATSYATDFDPSDGLVQAVESSGVTMTIESHTRTYTDKGAVAVTGASLTVDENGDPLATLSIYHIAYDDAARAGGAVAFVAYLDSQDAATSGAHPARHYVSTITTPDVGGTSQAPGASPPGWSGDDFCVTDDTPIQMANEAHDGAGEAMPASEVRAGDWVWTQNEATLQWGAFRVMRSSFAIRPIMAATGYPSATPRHRFKVGDAWACMEDLGEDAGTARVWLGKVEFACTYMSQAPSGEWVLSHNLKPV